MLFGVGVKCTLYCLVCCLLLKCKHKQINYIGWGRESWILPLLSITHIFVVSVRRSSSFFLSFFLSIDTESIKFRSSSQVWWVAKF